MSIENVENVDVENIENPFKNKLSFDFVRNFYWINDENPCKKLLLFNFVRNFDENNKRRGYYKEDISCRSKIVNLSRLNITNILDLIEEATPSIYYMVSWLEDHFKNKKEIPIPFKVEGAYPFYIPDDSVRIHFLIYFYDKFEEGKRCYLSDEHIDYIDNEMILDFELFKFDELWNGENILTKIKTRINEELLKIYKDITFAGIRIEYFIFSILPLMLEKK